MEQTTHIRLNMIVKNEADVIEGALNSALGMIDSFLIIDTGSTDATIEIIKQWSERVDCPGEVKKRDWVNFGHNRSEALDLAVLDGKATHILFLDADDRYSFARGFSREQIKQGQSYRIKNISGHIEYSLPDLISVDGKRWQWNAPLHEYLTPIKHKASYDKLSNVKKLKNIVTGGRSVGLTQREKYLRDAEILKEHLDSNPNEPRSLYYLAQSYRDAGEHELALSWYQARAMQPGWDQETYDSMLQAALCLERLGRVAEALLQLQRAWVFRESRRDAIYHCVRILRILGYHKLALHFADTAYTIDPDTSDILFVDKGASSWKLDDETAVSAYWEGDYQRSLDLSLRALETTELEPAVRDRINVNAVLARDKLLLKTRKPTVMTRKLFMHTPSLSHGNPFITLTITSCKRPDLFRRTLNSFLNSCVDVDRISRWVCVDDGTSGKELKQLKDEFPFMEFHTQADKVGSGHASSLNHIMSFLSGDYWVHLEDDWEFIFQDQYLERAIEVLDEHSAVAQALLNKNYAEDITDVDLAGSTQQIDSQNREYWLHDHISPSDAKYKKFFDNLPQGTLSNVWWPHYSLRPSIMKVQQLKSLGNFNVEHPNFELEFAQRYNAAGLKSAFLYRLACIHIGKKIRNGGVLEKNAYDLNDKQRYWT